MSKPHRVDVVVKFFLPLMAGIENNVANVYGNMAKKGWQVTLHVSKDLPEAKNSLPDHEIIRGLDVLRYRWHWFGYWPKIDWTATEAICFHNFDIFPHSWLLLYAGFRRVLGLKCPKIFLTPHGGFTPGWETFPFWQRLVKHLYQSTLGVFLINHVVDGFRSVSEWEAKESIKHGVKRGKIYIITNGLEDEAYLDIEAKASPHIKTLVKSLGKYVLQIGRIHPIKNQATSIKALAGLPKNVTLCLVGPVTDFDYKKQLDALIVDRKLNNRVKFLGVISGVDKYYLLRHCLVYSHMALWESYCNTVHESMSQGCICIVSKDTALEELIQDRHTGFTIPTFDYTSVAKKINYVLKHPHAPVLQQIKLACFAFVAGHSWQEISTQVADMYDHFLPFL